jgi:hypothetical protein
MTDRKRWDVTDTVALVIILVTAFFLFEPLL